MGLFGAQKVSNGLCDEAIAMVKLTSVIAEFSLMKRNSPVTKEPDGGSPKVVQKYIFLSRTARTALYCALLARWFFCPIAIERISTGAFWTSIQI